MSNLIKHAFKELELIGMMDGDEYNKMSVDAIMELLEVFSKQGHSGFSAPYISNTFHKLSKFKILSPLTGEDDEWCHVVEGMSPDDEDLWQNIRASHVFKNKNGEAWDIDGKVFIDPDGTAWTNSDSRVYVTFPYTPKTEYVKRELNEEYLIL